MKSIKAELRFLQTLFSLNLASAMEYRAMFISQIIGMFINNGIYFIFWLIFFDRFGEIKGYGVDDVFLLFAIIALSFGLAAALAGNTRDWLANLIAQGRLDYYLVLPRNLLTHVIFSRLGVYALGDIVFAIVAFLFTGRFHPVEIVLFFLTSFLAALVFIAYGVITGSLAFFMGNAQYTSQQMSNAVLTFAMYPNGLFTGMTRFVLFTLLPAGIVGAVPVEIVTARNWGLLGYLALAVVIFWTLAIVIFHLGLRRYESGSAINVNV